MTNIFNPVSGASTTVSLDSGASSTSAKVRTNGDPNQAVRVVNAGVSIAFILRGTSTVSASTADMPIMPNTMSTTPEIIALQPGDTHIAAVSSVSCKLYLTPGSVVR